MSASFPRDQHRQQREKTGVSGTMTDSERKTGTESDYERGTDTSRDIRKHGQRGENRQGVVQLTRQDKVENILCRWEHIPEGQNIY